MWAWLRTKADKVTTSSVMALEARLGAKLPEDYAEFLLDVNGGNPPGATACSRSVS